eukprot:g79263.t1
MICLVKRSDCQNCGLQRGQQLDKDGKIKDVPVPVPNLSPQASTTSIPTLERTRSKSGTNSQVGAPISPMSSSGRGRFGMSSSGRGRQLSNISDSGSGSSSFSPLRKISRTINVLNIPSPDNSSASVPFSFPTSPSCFPAVITFASNSVLWFLHGNLMLVMHVLIVLKFILIHNNPRCSLRSLYEVPLR